MQNEACHCISELYTVDKLLGQHARKSCHGHNSYCWQSSDAPYTCIYGQYSLDNLAQPQTDMADYARAATTVIGVQAKGRSCVVTAETRSTLAATRAYLRRLLAAVQANTRHPNFRTQACCIGNTAQAAASGCLAFVQLTTCLADHDFALHIWCRQCKASKQCSTSNAKPVCIALTIKYMTSQDTQQKPMKMRFW